MTAEIAADFAGTQRNEPPIHPAVMTSFLFVPTAGMRLAPDVLVLEMYREVFYDKFAGSPSKSEFKPSLEVNGDPAFTPRERAVIYALRGRKKATRQSSSDDFYAPAYPSLVRHSWLRRRSDRVVRDFLFRGAMAQYFRGTGQDRGAELENAVAAVYGALSGHRAADVGSVQGKEILSVAAWNPEVTFDEGATRDRLRRLISDDEQPFRTAGQDDEVAATISNDFLSVCSLEGAIPRMQWLSILMSFLRISLPVYLLAQMRLTVYLRDWILQALQAGTVPDDRQVMASVLNRAKGLFHPTSTPTREVLIHVEDYMRARVELDILLSDLETLSAPGLRGKRIVTTNRAADNITIRELLGMFRDARGAFEQQNGELTPRQAATRRSEEWPAWKDPLRKGQGKNYEEFIRVLYRAADGDEGGSYLLQPRGRGADRGFIVFPGPMLAATFALLADRAKEKKLGRHMKGKLMLSDLEDHIARYGVSFSAVAGARPRLIELLQEVGLLKGSPDAGESAEIICPY